MISFHLKKYSLKISLDGFCSNEKIDAKNKIIDSCSSINIIANVFTNITEKDRWSFFFIFFLMIKHAARL